MMRPLSLWLLAACVTLAVVACGETSPGTDPVGPAQASSAPTSTTTAPAPVLPAALPETPAALPATPAAPPAAAAAAPALIEERSGTTTNGAFVVSWVPQPDPIPFNEPYKLVVTVARAASPAAPERSARLELDATMPAHGHGMNRTPHVTAHGDGTFLVEGMLFHMSGEWNLIFHVYVGAEYGQVILRVELP